MSGRDQSLEDMLAALEGGSQPQRHSYRNQDHGITDIDDFLSKLEAESGGHTGGGDFDVDDFAELTIGNSQPSRQSYQQPAAPKQSSYQPPAAKPSSFNTNPKPSPFPPKSATSTNNPGFGTNNSFGTNRGGSAPAQRGGSMVKPQAQQNSFQSGGAAVDQVGERLLMEEGYVKHSNRGKFVNFSKGKATDFRIKGTTSSRVGLIHVITLRALDDYGDPCAITEVNPRDFIGVTLTLSETGRDIQPWFKDNNDATYDIAFYAEAHGTVAMQIKLAGNPMFDLSIQVDPSGDSLWVALLQNQDIQPHDMVVIVIVTQDDSRPEGVVPFEVQTMGDVTDLKLTNNGDGTYRFACIPQSVGHCTIQITLHEQPIQNSPICFKVGQEQKAFIKQSVGQQTPAARGVTPGAPRGGSNVPAAKPSAGMGTNSNFARPSQQPVAAKASTFASPVQQSRPQSTYQQKPQQATTSYARPQSTYGAPQYDDDGFEEDTQYNSHHQQPYGDYGNDGYGDGDGGGFGDGGGNVTNDDLNRLLDELGGGL